MQAFCCLILVVTSYHCFYSIHEKQITKSNPHSWAWIPGGKILGSRLRAANHTNQSIVFQHSCFKVVCKVLLQRYRNLFSIFVNICLCILGIGIGFYKSVKRVPSRTKLKLFKPTARKTMWFFLVFTVELPTSGCYCILDTDSLVEWGVTVCPKFPENDKQSNILYFHSVKMQELQSRRCFTTWHLLQQAT